MLINFIMTLISPFTMAIMHIRAYQRDTWQDKLGIAALRIIEGIILIIPLLLVIILMTIQMSLDLIKTFIKSKFDKNDISFQARMHNRWNEKLMR